MSKHPHHHRHHHHHHHHPHHHRHRHRHRHRHHHHHHHHIIISIIIKFIPTHHHRHQFTNLLLQLRSLWYNISSVLLLFVPPPWLNMSQSSNTIIFPTSSNIFQHHLLTFSNLWSCFGRSTDQGWVNYILESTWPHTRITINDLAKKIAAWYQLGMNQHRRWQMMTLTNKIGWIGC